MHASENNRTTFGPPQPPCKLKTKTKVCHDTKKSQPWPKIEKKILTTIPPPNPKLNNNNNNNKP
jgi:hypothetical protein